MQIKGPVLDNQPRVYVLFICEHYGIICPIEFAVDTGASKTTISEVDAVAKLEIDYRKLRKTRDSYGIGGRVPTYLLPACTLLFWTTSHSFHSIRLKRLHVLKFEPKTREEQIAVSNVPSLLGMDVLKGFSIRFTKRRVILAKRGPG